MEGVGVQICFCHQSIPFWKFSRRHSGSSHTFPASELGSSTARAPPSKPHDWTEESIQSRLHQSESLTWEFGLWALIQIAIEYLMIPTVGSTMSTQLL